MAKCNQLTHLPFKGLKGQLVNPVYARINNVV